MLNFLKKVFQKKELKKKIFLGTKKVEYDFIQWRQNILKKEIISLSCLDDLEILFIKSDINIKTVSYLMKEIKNQIKIKNITKSSDLLPLIKEVIISFYQKDDNLINTKNNSAADNKTKVFLFVGVNGVGKTTTIGKLAFQFKKKGEKVLLVAGDTFRTGAVEQLQKWGKQINVEVFFKEKNISASSLFFESLSYAKNKNFDKILCDTSGRLENKINLMKELEKVKRIINKHVPGAPHKTFLVLDAMTGQNGLKQVELFNQTVTLTNIILTKFDGISKCGLILTIKDLYKLPTKYIGIGEKVDDLIMFNIKDYVDILFEN